MSILINMEMPKSCYDCPLAMQDYTTLFGKTFNRTRNSYSCVLTHKKITSTKRNRFCPLVPVPPHGRLIDADALIDTLERTDWYHQSASKDMVHGANSAEHQAWYKEQDVYSAVDNAPTIIQASGKGVVEDGPCEEGEEPFIPF